MSTKFINILLIIILILASVLFIQHKTLNKLESEAKDYKSLYTQTKSNYNKVFRDKDSLLHLKQQITYVSDPKILKENEEIMKSLQQVNIKLKQLESFQKTNIENTTVIKTIVKDSIRLKDTLRCIEWSNKYSSLSGCFEDSLILKHKIILNKIGYFERSKFLGLKIGKKNHYIELYSENPNDSIIYNKEIIINNKKRK
jgi:hypothetical protein